MRAIILSAGKGERLYPMTRNLPKCLIEISAGRTVLELQLESLGRCGVFVLGAGGRGLRGGDDSCRLPTVGFLGKGG